MILILISPSCRYMIPLAVVFWAEYTCQSGAWTAFALPNSRSLASVEARGKAYQSYNLLYQVGCLGALHAHAHLQRRRLYAVGTGTGTCTRRHAYVWLARQVGVLISRGSGLICIVPRPLLLCLVALQCALLVAFVTDAATQQVDSHPLPLLTLPTPPHSTPPHLASPNSPA